MLRLPLFDTRLARAVGLIAALSSVAVYADTPAAKIPLSDAAQTSVTPLSCPSSGTEFSHARFDVGAVNLAYQMGPDNGPPLVILPGMSVPAESYRKSVASLCQNFQVFVITQRGHFETGWASDRSYHVSDYGGDVVKFIDGVIDEPVILSGHSLGALVGLWVASEHPEKISGYVAEDGPFLIQEAERWHNSWVKPMFVGLEARSRAYHEKGAQLEELVDMFAEERVTLPSVHQSYERRIMALGKTLSLNAPPPSAPKLAPDDAAHQRAAYALFLDGTAPKHGDFWPDTVLPLAVQSTLHLDPEVPAAAVDASITKGFDHRRAFSAVRAPTLYWESDREMVGVITAADHASLVERLRQNVRTRHVYAENSGHRIHRDQPERFAEEITSFFLSKAD